MRKLYKILGPAKYQNFTQMATCAIVNGDLSKVANLMNKYNIDLNIDDVIKHLS